MPFTLSPSRLLLRSFVRPYDTPQCYRRRTFVAFTISCQLSPTETGPGWTPSAPSRIFRQINRSLRSPMTLSRAVSFGAFTILLQRCFPCLRCLRRLLVSNPPSNPCWRFLRRLQRFPCQLSRGLRRLHDLLSAASARTDPSTPSRSFVSCRAKGGRVMDRREPSSPSRSSVAAAQKDQCASPFAAFTLSCQAVAREIAPLARPPVDAFDAQLPRRLHDLPHLLTLFAPLPFAPFTISSQLSPLCRYGLRRLHDLLGTAGLYLRRLHSVVAALELTVRRFDEFLRRLHEL